MGATSLIGGIDFEFLDGERQPSDTGLGIQKMELWMMDIEESESRSEPPLPESATAHCADETTFVPKIKHRASSYDRGVQIAAARLRLITDSRLGLETPVWVKKLAAEQDGSRAF